MKKSLLLLFLMAIIFALMVPLSLNVYQSQLAFTSDNLIFIHTAINNQ